MHGHRQAQHLACFNALLLRPPPVPVLLPDSRREYDDDDDVTADSISSSTLASGLFSGTCSSKFTHFTCLCN